MSVTAKSLIAMLEKSEELFGDSIPIRKNTLVAIADYTVDDNNEEWHWMPFVITGSTENYTNSELLKRLLEMLEKSGIDVNKVRSIAAFDNPTNEMIEHVMNNTITQEDSAKATFVYLNKDIMMADAERK